MYICTYLFKSGNKAHNTHRPTPHARNTENTNYYRTINSQWPAYRMKQHRLEWRIQRFCLGGQHGERESASL